MKIKEAIRMSVGIAILVIILMIVYLLPTFVGLKKRNALSIFVLNLFLGWSLVGWVVALVWATAKEESLEAGQLKKCPKCAEEVKVEAQICRFCGFDFTPKPIIDQAQPPPVKKRDPEVANLAANYINKMTSKK